MFTQVHCPQILLSKELDQYLEQGYFRMGQTIFTTNFLNFKNQFYSAIWLRVELADFYADSTFTKLLKKNSTFRTEFRPANISSEKEELFAKYKQCVSFEASSSLNQLLYGKATHTIFNTYEVNIYDNDKLIALGFFDLGEESAAGITSFYDPDYRKYSLGKYMIYLKMQYCKQLGMRYFYPGYFVPGYSSFDYKLEIGSKALQYLQLAPHQWLPISTFSMQKSPLQLMLDKLYALQNLLNQARIESKVLKYEFFDANLLPELKMFELFDFPLFVYCWDGEEDIIGPIVVFNVFDGQYHLLKCRSLWISNMASDNVEFYSSHLLKLEQDLLATDNPELIIDRLLEEMNYKLRQYRNLGNF